MRISDWSSDVCSSDLKPSVAKAVTLEVSPQQAQKLALASQLGSLALMLRNLGDAEPEMVKTITTRDLSVGEANNPPKVAEARSEEHTSELQSLMRISYAVFCLKKKQIARAILQTSTLQQQQD